MWSKNQDLGAKGADWFTLSVPADAFTPDAHAWSCTLQRHKVLFQQDLKTIFS